MTKLYGHNLLFLCGKVFVHEGNMFIGDVLDLFFSVFCFVFAEAVFLELLDLFDDSRRILRMATLDCSPSPDARRTNSFLRSSVSGGIKSRMILPSFCGVTPRLALMMALSIG